MKRNNFSGLLTVCVAALLILMSIGSAKAETPSYMSLGYQKTQWDIGSSLLSGSGWYLDGAYSLGQGLSLTGEYSKSDYDIFTSSEWQLGGRWSERGFSNAVFGLEYRYINLTVEAGDKESDEFGHQGAFDLSIPLAFRDGASAQGVLELGAALTAYESEDRALLSIGYRSYLNRSFSLALHVQQESDDRRWLALSVREEK